MNNESIPSNISDSPDDHLDREALSWLVCRHSGLSTEEEERFQTWLAGDPARRTAFARWQAEWDVLDDLPADGLDILRKTSLTTNEPWRKCTSSVRSVLL